MKVLLLRHFERSKDGIKRQGIFQKKEWAKVTADTYQEHIVLVVDEWIKAEDNAILNWTFMQDNAPCHKARSTLAELERQGIKTTMWPPFSPDRNPIGHG